MQLKRQSSEAVSHNTGPVKDLSASWLKGCKKPTEASRPSPVSEPRAGPCYSHVGCGGLYTAEDRAPQHPAARELPARGTLREGVELCTKPLVTSTCDNSWTFPKVTSLLFLLTPGENVQHQHRNQDFYCLPSTQEGGEAGAPMF